MVVAATRPTRTNNRGEGSGCLADREHEVLLIGWLVGACWRGTSSLLWEQLTSLAEARAEYFFSLVSRRSAALHGAGRRSICPARRDISTQRRLALPPPFAMMCPQSLGTTTLAARNGRRPVVSLPRLPHGRDQGGHHHAPVLAAQVGFKVAGGPPPRHLVHSRVSRRGGAHTRRRAGPSAGARCLSTASTSRSTRPRACRCESDVAPLYRGT